MKINEVVEQYPVEFEDMGEIKIEVNTAVATNMQINNVGPNAEFLAFVNAEFDLEWEQGDSSVGVGQGYIVELDAGTVDIKALMDENGETTPISADSDQKLIGLIDEQVTEFLRNNGEFIADYAEEDAEADRGYNAISNYELSQGY